MKRFYTSVFVLSLSCSAWFFVTRASSPQAPAAAPPTKHWIAGGKTGGTYLKLAAAIAEAAGPALNLHACASDGSEENAGLLRNREVQYALLQTSTVHDQLRLSKGEQQTSTNMASQIKLITKLYSEKLHIFVRPHSYIASPADLKDRHVRVWLGPPGSGTAATAKEALKASGFDLPAEVAARPGQAPPPQAAEIPPTAHEPTFFTAEMSWKEAERQLLLEPAQSGIDAFFRVTSVPRNSNSAGLPNELSQPTAVKDCRERLHFETAPVQGRELQADSKLPPKPDFKTLFDGDARLVGLSSPVLDRISEDEVYVRTVIRGGSYGERQQGVLTIGTPALLATGDGTSKKEVEELLGAIASHQDKIEKKIGGVDLDLLNSQFSNKGVFRDSVHEGAKKHLLTQTLPVEVLILAGMALITVIWLAHRYQQRIRRMLAAQAYMILLAVILASVWLFCAGLRERIEGPFNSDFGTLWGSGRTMLLFIIGHQEAHRPLTRQGEIITWIALVSIAMIMGWLQSDVVKSWVRRGADRLADFIQRVSPKHTTQWLSSAALWIRRTLRRTARDQAKSSRPIVILNWDERGPGLLRELRAQKTTHEQEFIVIPSVAPDPPLEAMFPRVRTIVGDPGSIETLRKAEVPKAAAITILSSWHPADPQDRRRKLDPDVADAKTLLAIWKISSLCKESDRPSRPPIRAEILLEKNVAEVRKAGLDDGTEFISV